jgi:hypothetical protein
VLVVRCIVGDKILAAFGKRNPIRVAESDLGAFLALAEPLEQTREMRNSAVEDGTRSGGC